MECSETSRHRLSIQMERSNINPSLSVKCSADYSPTTYYHGIYHSPTTNNYTTHHPTAHNQTINISDPSNNWIYTNNPAFANTPAINHPAIYHEPDNNH